MIQETVLKAVHEELGAKLVDFSGWLMPLHYGSQMEEHHAVRRDAGVFDVSHMTVVDVTGADAQTYLQHLLANDVAKLKLAGKALYSAMLNNAGGVIDDLIVYRMEEGYRLVVNCGTRDKDLAWMGQQARNFDVSVQEREYAMVAVQGPNARAKVDGLLAADELKELAVFQGVDLTAQGKEGWFVARTGYTGEDGYEIILPEADAVEFWQALLAEGVAPCGLGARDTLRLEAGMNLYGHEMDDEISPLVANMGWTIAWGPSARNFVGRDVIEQERERGVKEVLVGLILEDKGVLRAGYEVSVPGAEEVGVVTSGTFSPTLGVSVALARIPKVDAEHCEVRVRNKSLRAKIVAPSFVRNGKALN